MMPDRPKRIPTGEKRTDTKGGGLLSSTEQGYIDLYGCYGLNHGCSGRPLECSEGLPS